VTGRANDHRLVKGDSVNPFFEAARSKIPAGGCVMLWPELLAMPEAGREGIPQPSVVALAVGLPELDFIGEHVIARPRLGHRCRVGGHSCARLSERVLEIVRLVEHLALVPGP